MDGRQPPRGFLVLALRGPLRKLHTSHSATFCSSDRVMACLRRSLMAAKARARGCGGTCLSKCREELPSGSTATAAQGPFSCLCRTTELHRRISKGRMCTRGRTGETASGNTSASHTAAPTAQSGRHSSHRKCLPEVREGWAGRKRHTLGRRYRGGSTPHGSRRARPATAASRTARHASGPGCPHIGRDRTRHLRYRRCRRHDSRGSDKPSSASIKSDSRSSAGYSRRSPCSPCSATADTTTFRRDSVRVRDTDSRLSRPRILWLHPSCSCHPSPAEISVPCPCSDRASCRMHSSSSCRRLSR
jgi:hypothetical protein